MNRVFKYDLPIDDHFTLDLPRHAKIVSFQGQQEKPVIWALVDPEESPTRREFRLAGTGHPIEEKDTDLDHVGTCQLHGGSLVLHLFEVIRF